MAKAKEALAAAKGSGDSRRTKEFAAQLAGEELKLQKARETEAAAAVAQERGGIGGVEARAAAIAAQFHDTLAEHLDAQHGASVTDKDIYRCAAHDFALFIASNHQGACSLVCSTPPALSD